MPLKSISPEHSFVNFEHKLDSFIMPAYGSAAVAFQITLDPSTEIPIGDTITAGVSDAYGNVLYESAAVIVNVCAMARITGIDFVLDFPLTIAAGQHIEQGVYATPEDFYTGVRKSGYGALDKDFLHCCPVEGDVTFQYNAGKTGRIKFYKGLQQVTIPADEVTFMVDIDVTIGECFYYFVKHSSGIIFSNNFKRVPDDKFLTKVTYSSNEDAYGFNFRSPTMFNQVWLPLVSRNPLYPTTRKVYLMSNKKYKVQSSSIEKEYQCKTDRLPATIHEKIVVMLDMDNVRFDNRKVNSLVYKKDEYTIDWTDEDFTDIDIATAKFKVQQPFEGRNSNCEKRKICDTVPVGPGAPPCIPASMVETFDLPNAVVDQFYNPVFHLTGKQPFILSDLIKPAWMDIYLSSDTIIFSGQPTAPGTNVPVSFTIDNCDGVSSVHFADTINITEVLKPSMTEMTNTVIGSTRTQVYQVGPNVSEGNVFYLMVYSHGVEITAVFGDTPTTIAQKLTAKLNATSTVEWNDHGSGPTSTTPGFPPHATSSGNQITLTLNVVNQFAGGASVY